MTRSHYAGALVVKMPNGIHVVLPMITSIDLYDKEFVRLASQFMNPSYVIGADFRDRKLRFETMELSKRVQTKCFLTFPQTLVPYYLARAMTME